MGLNTHAGGGSKVFLQVVNGKLAARSKEGAPNAVSRKNKNEEIVWEVLHDSLTGTIKEMKVENKVFPSGKTKQLEITMTDVDETFVITLPVESKFFDHFCSKIGSANLSKSIEVKPYAFVPKGESQKKSGLNLFQNEQKLPYFFSPENPMGKPFPPTDRMDEDDYKMFKIKERKFYCEYILGMDKIPAATTPPVVPRSVPSDDLPF